MSYETMKARKDSILKAERKGLSETNLLSVIVELYPHYEKWLSTPEIAIVEKYPHVFNRKTHRGPCKNDMGIDAISLTDTGRLLYQWAHDFTVKGAESEAQRTKC